MARTVEPDHHLVGHHGGEVLGPQDGSHQLPLAHNAVLSKLSDIIVKMNNTNLVQVHFCKQFICKLFWSIKLLLLGVWYQVKEMLHDPDKL